MVIAVLGVVALASLDLHREQQRAMDDFTSEQLTLAREFAASVHARFAGITRDLAAIASPATDDAVTLARFVGDGHFYREADVLDPGGRVLVAVPADPSHAIAASPVLLAARAAAVRAARPGAPYVSAPLHADGGRHMRLFATAGANGQVAVLLVHGDALFGAPAPAGGAVAARRLVVDRPGGWMEWEHADPSLPASLEGEGAVPGLAELIAAMTAGGDGAVTLDRPTAVQLGFQKRLAVAGYAPAGDGRWSVAVITSAVRVRNRARVGTWRLVAATAMAALFAGLFGVAVAREQRRATALAEQLKHAETTAALRERAEKIVEAIPLGVMALDGNGRVTSVNPFLAERGVTVEDPLAPTLASLVDSARRTRTPAHQPGVPLTLGGAAREVDAYAIPLGRPLADVDAFLVLHDRTEERALENQLVRAEKLATVGTLTAGVAHEIGTPLGIISGRAESLLAQAPAGETGEPLRKGLGSIIAQVDKVSTTIRQLLDFARVRPIEGGIVGPARLLEGAASLLEHHFRRAKVSLAVDAPPVLPPISGDPGQIEQVIVNVMMNAVDACAPGGHVDVRARSDGPSRVAIEVVDDGCGIPKEQLAAVFDPFFTTKKRGQGTGLGLTIAADIVKNHGGALTLDSEPGRGTTVRVTLPATKDVTP